MAISVVLIVLLVFRILCLIVIFLGFEIFIYGLSLLVSEHIAYSNRYQRLVVYESLTKDQLRFSI